MSALSQVVKGKQQGPKKLVVFGAMGVGKSVFGSSAPSPIFMDVEASTSELDVSRFPRPATYEDMLSGIRELATEKHDYKTFVLDTIDAAETLVWDYVISNARKDPKYASITNLEEVGGGYGKGAVAALMAWRVVFQALDILCEKKGMNVIVLGHAAVKKFNSPEVAIEPFDRYVLKLLPSTAAFVSEWPQAMLFANYEVMSTDKNNKTFGVSSGKRVLHTTHSAAWDAKNRFGLPPTIPLSWASFEAASSSSITTSVESITKEITELLKTKGVKTVEKSHAGMERAGSDLAKLTTLLNWIKGQS
jgi:hypothetical protein